MGKINMDPRQIQGYFEKFFDQGNTNPSLKINLTMTTEQ